MEKERLIKNLYNEILTLYTDTPLFDDDRASLYTRITYVIEKLNNDNFLLNAYDLKEIAKILKYFFDKNTTEDKSYWLNDVTNLNQKKEIIFRDIISHKYLGVFNLNELKNYVSNNDTIQKKEPLLKFLDLYENYNINPRRKKSEIKYNLNYTSFESINCQTPYIYLFSYFYDIYDFDNDEEPYAFIDFFCYILYNAIDEFINNISFYFDSNIGIFSKNNEILEYLIIQLKDLNKIFDEKLKEFINSFNNNKNNNIDLVPYFTITESYKTKSTRNQFLKECSKLFSKNNFDITVLNLPPKPFSGIYAQETKIQTSSISKKTLCKYCVEKEISKTTFNNHLKMLNELNKYYHLNKKLINNSDVPTIGFRMDIDNLLDFKILYNSFFTDINIFKSKNTHDRDNNISSKTMLTNIIATLKKEQNISTYLYTDKTNDNNQKNNLLHRHSIYITEKIRSNYYRVFSEIKQYEKTFEYRLETNNLLTEILHVKDIGSQFELFVCFLADYLNTFRNFEGLFFDIRQEI